MIVNKENSLKDSNIFGDSKKNMDNNLVIMAEVIVNAIGEDGMMTFYSKEEFSKHLKALAEDHLDTVDIESINFDVTISTSYGETEPTIRREKRKRTFDGVELTTKELEDILIEILNSII